MYDGELYKNSVHAHIFLLNLACTLTHTIHSFTQVRTQLAHPTNYHVSEMQRKQVQQFLTQHGTPIQTRSAPAHNLTGFGLPRAASLGGAQKDPLLSGAMGASGSSPLKPNSFNPTMGSPIKHSPVNPCEWKYMYPKFYHNRNSMREYM